MRLQHPVNFGPLSRVFIAVAAFAAFVLPSAFSWATGLPELETLARSGLKVSAVFRLDGREVASLNQSTRLNPASVTKLFSAALALKTVGPDRRCETSVYRAPDERLVIEGCGDPGLTSRHLDELAACVASKGSGNWSKLVFSTGPFSREDMPPQYTQKNTQSPYRAGVAGLQIDLNAVSVTIGGGKPGEKPSIRVSPASDYFRIDNRATVSAAGKSGAASRKKTPLSMVTSTDESGRMLVSLTGFSNPGKSVVLSSRVDNPAWNAAAAFVESLSTHNVRVRSVVPERGTVPAGSTKICSKQSAPMREIIVPMLKDSINPIAESVMRIAGAEGASSPVGFSEGAARLKDMMLHDVRAPAESFVFTNGSGLYGANRVAASAVVDLLAWMRGRPDLLPAFAAALPVGGVDGTLKKRFNSEILKGRVHAKTGTLDEAISLAGWVDMPDGRHLLFAVLVEGEGKLPAAGVRKAIDTSVSNVFKSLTGLTDKNSAPEKTKRKAADKPVKKANKTRPRK